MKILLSRTDNIGDVIFTLPMAGLIKKYYPKSKVYFLGKSYTRAIVECCSFIDGFYTFEDIQQEQFDVIIHVFPNKEIAYFAKKQKIKMRIGTSRRFFHWLTCNRLVNLTRKNSDLHEAQLNIKLLRPLHIQTKISLAEIPDYYGFSASSPGPSSSSPVYPEGATGGAIDENKFNLIIHPKSKGSAREWCAEHYVELCNSLSKEKFNIFVSGTKEEEQEIREKILSKCSHVKNVVGLFSLEEFIVFIAQCDGLLACSTGPLHIAAALGKHALGLYPPIKNMLPTRWGALGKRAQNLVGERGVNSIRPRDISDIINGWEK